jgi:DNA-binding response OmpR family regulator
MDVVARTVVRGGRMIDLTAKEFAILEYLLRNKDRSVTRSQIIDHVWSYNFDYGTNIVDVYIRYIRRKIDDDFDIKLIRTMRGIGYTIRSER